MPVSILDYQYSMTANQLPTQVRIVLPDVVCKEDIDDLRAWFALIDRQLARLYPPIPEPPEGEESP